MNVYGLNCSNKLFVWFCNTWMPCLTKSLWLINSLLSVKLTYNIHKVSHIFIYCYTCSICIVTLLLYVLLHFLYMYCYTYSICIVTLTLYVLLHLLYMYCYTYSMCIVTFALYALLHLLYMYCYTYSICIVTLTLYVLLHFLYMYCIHILAVNSSH